MSAFSAFAMSRTFCAGTITPRSTTSKLLQRSTTPTMFLPVSCTSPLTVAITICCLISRHLRCGSSASMRGSRYATAFFMTRADLTTCGRNILPAPKRSPTTFMPSISGPSITSRGRRGKLARFFGVCVDERIDAMHERDRRARIGSARHARFSTTASPFLDLYRSAISSRRSVASLRRLSTTSSTRSCSSGSRSS